MRQPPSFQFLKPLAQKGRALSAAVLGLAGLAVVYPSPADAAEPSHDVLHTFRGQEFAECNMTLAGPAHVIGSTYNAWLSGDKGDGQLWEWREKKGFRVLHRFDFNTAERASPRVAPTLADDGNWYLPIEQDYFTEGFGTPELAFFRWRPDGSGEVFVSKGQTSGDTMHHSSMLVQGPDRRLYGYSMKTGNGSLLFALTLDGGLEVMHHFEQGELSRPTGCGLTLGPDQAMYGVTERGGARGGGALYRLAADGSLRSVHYFPKPAKGDRPVRSAVVLGSDGKLYGVANRVIYRINADGTGYEVITTVTEKTLQPMSVKEGPDGFLYGGMSRRSTCCNGKFLLYRLAKTGKLTLMPGSKAGGVGVVEPSASGLFAFRLREWGDGGLLTRSTLP